MVRKCTNEADKGKMRKTNGELSAYANNKRARWKEYSEDLGLMKRHGGNATMTGYDYRNGQGLE